MFDRDEPSRNIDDFRKQRIGTIKAIVDGYVTDVDYCLDCKSTDIKVSKKGNKYCGKICRKKD